MLLYRNQWGICNLIKKILPIILIIFLVLSGINFTTISADKKIVKKSVTKLAFSKPVFTDKKECISVSMDGVNSFLMETGKPVLPVVSKTFVFPIGTKIVDVKCTSHGIKQETLSKKIVLAPKPIPVGLVKASKKIVNNKDVEKQNSCLSEDFFPKKYFDYHIGCGIDKGKHVIFLNVHLYPIRYRSMTNVVEYVQDMEIEVVYDKPTKPLTSIGNFDYVYYDLMIITPSKFEDVLLPLVDHKNSYDVQTMVKTTEDIYSEYSEGRDKPEQIKYAIKDAIETWGVKYVLLVGGRKGQTFDWYVPVRYTNNDDGWEGGYISDLYYADIYDNEGKFSSWDSNGNGVFAEWKGLNKDVMDFYPDVYVGRLACRSKREVETVVDKIIKYESSAYNSSWFKKAVVVAGDTFPPARDCPSGCNEGELETGVTVSLLEGVGFDVEKQWVSLGTLTGRQAVINAIVAGTGFVHFAGHGNPAIWGTFPTNAENESDFIDGLMLRDMPKLKNRYKLPVIVVGGCHNSQFNVTIMNIIKGILKDKLKYFDGRFWYMEWVPECWSWSLVRQKNGGAIATIGNTGLGYGYVDADTNAGLGGWIEPRFFDAYANQSIDVLGEAHAQAITDYINIIGNVNSDQIDRKTIEEWVLLGDPSLKIGGYPDQN